MPPEKPAAGEKRQRPERHQEPDQDDRAADGAEYKHGRPLRGRIPGRHEQHRPERQVAQERRVDAPGEQVRVRGSNGNRSENSSTTLIGRPPSAARLRIAAAPTMGLGSGSSEVTANPLRASA